MARQNLPEQRFAAGFQRQRAAMGEGDLAGEAEPYAGALGLGRVEGAKDAGGRIRGHSGAVIRHIDRQPHLSCIRSMTLGDGRAMAASAASTAFWGNQRPANNRSRSSAILRSDTGRRVGSGNRSARGEVMKLAQARNIDAILVTEPSRWGRSTQDLLDTLSQLTGWRVSIVAMSGMTFEVDTPHRRMPSIPSSGVGAASSRTIASVSVRTATTDGRAARGR